jgi:nucleoid-associated protein YgaU
MRSIFLLDIEQPFGRLLPMTRTRVRWGRVAALAASAILMVGVAGKAAGAAGTTGAVGPERQHAATRAYVVRAGDTLWSIASRLSGPSADLRPLVDRIAAENHVTGSLPTGAVLHLPSSP